MDTGRTRRRSDGDIIFLHRDRYECEYRYRTIDSLRRALCNYYREAERIGSWYGRYWFLGWIPGLLASTRWTGLCFEEHHYEKWAIWGDREENTSINIWKTRLFCLSLVFLVHRTRKVRFHLRYTLRTKNTSLLRYLEECISSKGNFLCSVFWLIFSEVLLCICLLHKNRWLHTPPFENSVDLTDLWISSTKQIHIQAPTPNYTNRSHHKGGTPKYKSWLYSQNKPKCSRPKMTSTWR